MGDGKQIRQGRPEEGRGRSRKKAKQIKFPQRRKKGRPKVERPKVAHDPQITRKRSGKFHFDRARFLRALLAPSLPRAVRVFLGRCAIVFFRLAARAAFLMFRFAAARCFLVVTIAGSSR